VLFDSFFFSVEFPFNFVVEVNDDDACNVVAGFVDGNLFKKANGDEFVALTDGVDVEKLFVVLNPPNPLKGLDLAPSVESPTIFLFAVLITRF
jgi:hypothetical protein